MMQRPQGDSRWERCLRNFGTMPDVLFCRGKDLYFGWSGVGEHPLGAKLKMHGTRPDDVATVCRVGNEVEVTLAPSEVEHSDFREFWPDVSVTVPAVIMLGEGFRQQGKTLAEVMSEEGVSYCLGDLFAKVK